VIIAELSDRIFRNKGAVFVADRFEAVALHIGEIREVPEQTQPGFRAQAANICESETR